MIRRGCRARSFARSRAARIEARRARGGTAGGRISACHPRRAVRWWRWPGGCSIPGPCWPSWPTWSCSSASSADATLLVMRIPAVSVLMGVHNGMPWITEAVASVLGQTAADLELVVVDDGSTDATPDALAAVADPRLRVIRQARQGLTRALNHGLSLTTEQLIAR